MASKKQLANYIAMIEQIQEEHPEIKDKLDTVITEMQNDYNDLMYRELERQRIRKAVDFKHWLETDNGKKVEQLEQNQFIVVPIANKGEFRMAKKAVTYKYPDRSFSMRFTKGVGTLLTRIK